VLISPSPLILSFSERGEETGNTDGKFERTSGEHARLGRWFWRLAKTLF
jgi:hypothetical protein